MRPRIRILSLVCLVAQLRGRVIRCDLICGDSDVRVLLNSLGNRIIAVSLAAKRLHLVAYHPDKGFDGKHFGLESGELAECFLRAKGLFDGVSLLGAVNGHLCSPGLITSYYEIHAMGS